MRALLICVALALSCQPRGDAPFVRLRLALWGTLEPVGPGAPTGSQTSLIQGLVFEPLARVDPSGRLAPQLARSLVPIDASHYLVTLSGDAKFSDGSQVTNQDVIDSMADTGLKATPRDGSLIVETVTVGAPAEPLIPRVLIFRRAGDKLLGTGPFMVSQEDADHIVLTRRVRVPHRIDELSVLRFEGAKDAFARTLKGDADLLLLGEPRWVEFFENMQTVRIVRAPGVNSDAIVFNPRLPRDDRRRLARILASDAVRTAAFGNACPPLGRIATSDAKGPPLRLIAVAGSERLAMAVRRAITPRVAQLEILPKPKMFLDRIQEGSYDLAAAFVLTWPPSAMALTWHSRSQENLIGYSNPAVDAALTAADWPKAAALLADDAAMAPICNRERVAIVDARVTNPTLSAYDPFENLPDWEVSP